MSRSLPQAGAVLFIAAGIFVAAVSWESFQAIKHSTTADFTTEMTFAVVYAVTTALGFMALTQQARAERHWLGWLGVALTVLGSLARVIVDWTELTSNGSALSIERSPALMLLALFFTPVFALGLVFWAMDLPNTAKPPLFQKAMMGALALLTPFYSAAAQSQQLIFHSTNLSFLLILFGIINTLLWFGLAASILLDQTQASSSRSAPETPASPNSSFVMTISPIPPAEQ